MNKPTAQHLKKFRAWILINPVHPSLDEIQIEITGVVGLVSHYDEELGESFEDRELLEVYVDGVEVPTTVPDSKRKDIGYRKEFHKFMDETLTAACQYSDSEQAQAAVTLPFESDYYNHFNGGKRSTQRNVEAIKEAIPGASPVVVVEAVPADNAKEVPLAVTMFEL